MSTVLEVLQHALGRDRYGRRPSEGPDLRNHFCAEEGTGEFESCRAALALGLMAERRPFASLTGDCYLFSVTEQGVRFVERWSPLPPKGGAERAFEGASFVQSSGSVTFGGRPRVGARG